MTMLKEMQDYNDETKGVKQNKGPVNDKAKQSDKMQKAEGGKGGDNEVDDLGGPVVKGDEDTGPFNAEDDVKPPKKRRGDNQSNKDKMKDITKSKLVTKAYESLTSLSKEELVERIEAIEAAISGSAYLDEDSLADLSEEVDTLLGNEDDLSEEFKKKATTILEAKFNSTVREEKNRLNELYESRIAEEKQQIEEEMTEKLDSYLDYATTEWMRENKLAVDAGIKNEIAESFMSGIYDLLESHGLSAPEGSEDVLTRVNEENESLKEQNNEMLDVVLEMKTALKTLMKENVVNSVCEDLVATEKEKIANLVEDVSFDDMNDLTEKVQTLKDYHISESKNESDNNSSNVLSEDILSAEQQNLNETNEDGENDLPVSSDPDINKLAQSITRFGYRD